MKTKIYKIFCLRAALFAALLFAGCDNPAGGSSSGGENTGNTVEIILDMEGNLTVTGAGGTIYKDREPSHLELKLNGEDWESLSWYVDGAARNEWRDTATVTISAEAYTEARHIVALTAVRNGASYSTTIPITVTRERPRDIVWTQTENDSSLMTFDLSAWAGDGTPTENWSLNVMEQGEVYFAARKHSNTIINVTNKAGVYVSKARSGETVDGSTANSGMDIFTVSFSDPDAAFGEGAGSFTLEVSEAGRAVKKTVNVAIAVRPNLLGVAIFHRESNGRLTRITEENAGDHANSLYATHKAGTFPAWGIDFSTVANLSTALKWLDNYALSGNDPTDMAEYLVRVEQDEAMPKTMISCHMTNSQILAEYVRIRIRGYGGERIITHDRGRDTGYVQKVVGSSLSHVQGFLGVGSLSTSGNYKPNYIAVHMENNITIDGEGGENTLFPSGESSPGINSMVSVSKGNTLVMETDSRLIRFKSSLSTGTFLSFTPVYLENGVFEFRGGEISDILQPDDGNACIVSYSDNTTSRVIYYQNGYEGGAPPILRNNTGDNVAIGYLNRVPVSDPQFAPAP